MKTDNTTKGRLFAALRRDWPWYGFLFVVMWALKHHYSTAGAEQLAWILEPTARLVQWADGLPYTLVAGKGYVRSDYLIVIAPVCAGVNFMIMALGLGGLGVLRGFKSILARVFWLGVVFGGAYAMTICVNTMRILVSIVLFEMDLSWGWLTPERIHRVIGTGFYFGFLWLYYAGLTHIIGAVSQHPAGTRSTGFIFPLTGTAVCAPGPVTLAWYLCGALGVPLLHQLWRGGALPTAEHALTVVLVSVALMAGVRCLRHLFRTGDQLSAPGTGFQAAGRESCCSAI